MTPKPYEEYMLGLSRFLAKSTDNGSITPKELAETFNAGWNYMVAAMKKESALLASNLTAAQLSDAQTWKMIGEIAVGLAAVATVTLAASATTPAPPPPPASVPSYVYVPAPTPPTPRTIHCRARQPVYTVYIDCYESR